MKEDLKEILKIVTNKLSIEYDENRFSDFDYLSNVFEQVKKRRDELSKEERHSLNSAYLKYVSSMNNSTLKEYNNNLGYFTNNFRVNDIYHKNDSINYEEIENTEELPTKKYKDSGSVRNYKLHKSNKKRNTKGLLEAIKKGLIILLSTGIVLTVGSCVSNNVKLPNTNEGTTQEEIIDEFNNDYLSFDYTLELGDNCKNDVADRLEIKTEDLRVKGDNKPYNNSFYKMQAGDVINMEVKNNEYNKEKVDDYNYSHKDVSVDYKFSINFGDNLVSIASSLMENNPELKEVYKTPNELCELMAKQNNMTVSDYYPGDYIITVTLTQKLIEEYHVKTNNLSK